MSAGVGLHLATPPSKDSWCQREEPQACWLRWEVRCSVWGRARGSSCWGEFGWRACMACAENGKSSCEKWGETNRQCIRPGKASPVPLLSPTREVERPCPRVEAWEGQASHPGLPSCCGCSFDGGPSVCFTQ